jgi:hypothetical protein
VLGDRLTDRIGDADPVHPCDCLELICLRGGQAQGHVLLVSRRRSPSVSRYHGGGRSTSRLDPLYRENGPQLNAALAGHRNPASRQGSRRRGWSINGAERWQTVATGGKSLRPENGSNKPKPLPPVAAGCRSERMVKSMFATACHRLPTIPYLLERKSIAWLRKGDREPLRPQGNTAPFRSPARTRILSMSVASVGRHPRTAQRAKAGA